MSCPHVKFLCFATFFLKFFVAEAKKNIQTDLIFFLFQQQKTCVASMKTWENPRLPATWVDFLKHFFFYLIKFTERCFYKNGLKRWTHSSKWSMSILTQHLNPSESCSFNSLNIVWEAPLIFLRGILGLVQIVRVRLFFLVCSSSSKRRATDAITMILFMAAILKNNCLKISTDFVPRVFVAWV